MVRLTLAKLAAIRYPKIKKGLPGATFESIKHHISTFPIYFFTVGGGIISALYCMKLGLYQDVTILKAKPFKDISPDAKIPLILTEANSKTLEAPKNRPQVKEGHKFED